LFAGIGAAAGHGVAFGKLFAEVGRLDASVVCPADGNLEECGRLADSVERSESLRDRVAGDLPGVCRPGSALRRSRASSNAASAPAKLASRLSNPRESAACRSSAFESIHSVSASVPAECQRLRVASRAVAKAGVTARRLAGEQRAEHEHDVFGFRITTDHRLREDELTVDVHIETSPVPVTSSSRETRCSYSSRIWAARLTAFGRAIQGTRYSIRSCTAFEAAVGFLEAPLSGRQGSAIG